MGALHSISGATDDDYCDGCGRIICVCPPPPEYFTRDRCPVCLSYGYCYVPDRCPKRQTTT